jgi:hypothetical protein
MVVMAERLICILTIHGIGFEQAPLDGVPGYADGLHQRLSRALGPDVLGDDPHRERGTAGENGAIYVQSLWIPDPDSGEGGAASHVPTQDEGLRRLGSWASRANGQIDTSGAPLVGGAERVAHVALVYSHLEAVGPHLGAAAVVTEMTAASLAHYASIKGLAGMLFHDIGALFDRPHKPADEPPPSLQVRRDLPPRHSWLHRPFAPKPAAAPPQPSGVFATLRNLEDDVAAYVSRNDLRERVRDFVREAVVRLASREDVAGIVVNAHSNGTVVAYDVLRDLPSFMAQKVLWFATAGSPLRKYVEIFNWGTEAGTLAALAGWTNFWDDTDPVADPLAPPVGWRRGDDPPASADPTSLYQSTDPATGEQRPVLIADHQVENLAHGGRGGLPAHDYWDNDLQVVQTLAEIVSGLLA